MVKNNTLELGVSQFSTKTQGYTFRLAFLRKDIRIGCFLFACNLLSRVEFHTYLTPFRIEFDKQAQDPYEYSSWPNRVTLFLLIICFFIAVEGRYQICQFVTLA